MSRPAFSSDGLPEGARQKAEAHAARSWVFVTAGGFPYFGLTEERARQAQALRGGTIHSPEDAA